jgi:hypothetical protein
MSAISTSKISPPIPCVGVEYGYSTPPSLNPNSLGYNVLTTQTFSPVLTLTPSVTATLISVTDIPAGTYIFTYVIQCSDVVGQVFEPQITTSAGGSSGIPVQQGGTEAGQYQGFTQTWISTSSIPFTANLNITAFVAGLGSNVVDANLHYIRIA